MHNEKRLITYDKFYRWVTVEYKLVTTIVRSKERITRTNEIFTNLDFVLYGLTKTYPSTYFQDSTIIYSDSCAGEGVWLIGMALKRMEHGMKHEDAIQNLRAIELMPDNVQLCRDRLLCGQEHLRHIVERNIVCHDALTYDYSFNGTNFTDAELREQELGLPAPGKKQKKVKAAKKELTPNLSAFDES